MPARALCGVQDLVEEWVRRQPQECAVHDPSADAGSARLSYAQLWQRSAVLAADLVAAGVRRGDVVAVDLDRSVDLVVAMLGVIRSGAAYLPLDSHAPADRVAAVLDEARAAMVVGSAGRVPAGDPRPRLAVPRSGHDEHLPAGPGAGGDDPVYVMYTSGSTGRPKGVVVPHRAVIRLVHQPNYCTVRPGDRVANSSNPAFDASTFEIWSTLTAGGTVVVFPAVTEIGLDDWQALLRSQAITTMFLTTSLFHTVARERPDAFAAVRNLVVGGEQLELTAVRRVLAAAPPGRLVNGYGPTETTTFAAYFECTHDSLAGLSRIPVGFPLQNTTLHVLGDDLRPVPPGQTGELCIGGPGVALGYLGQPELTAQRFVREPATGARVYRTGDLARQLPGGAIELLGRRDRQVKLRGFRIELEEIEQAAVATGLVDAAFVEKVGEGPSAVLAAVVLPARSAADDVTAELARELARRLPEYMIPARWLVLSRLPVGPTGKADRARLRALLADGGTDHPGPAETPADPLTDQLRLLCQEVLGVPRADAGDSFLDLGGNSITAVQLVSRIQARFAAQLEPADILLAESIADLAERLREITLSSPARPAARV